MDDKKDVTPESVAQGGKPPDPSTVTSTATVAEHPVAMDGHTPAKKKEPATTWQSVVTVGTAVMSAAVLALTLTRGSDQKVSPQPTELRWKTAAHVPYTTYKELLKRDGWTDAQEHGYSKWDTPSVSVYSVPYTPPSPAPLTLKDLSDNGQAHAIDYIFKNLGDKHTDSSKDDADKSAKEPQSALQNFVSAISAQSNATRADPYRANRVLVATVAKGLNSQPGDRILWSRIFIKPVNFQFAGYNVVASDNRSIKIASVENTTETKFSFKAPSPTVAGVSSGGPEATNETDKSQKTTADVNQPYENLGVDIQPGFMRIIRESAKDGDVAGNTIIQLSMVTDPYQIWCSHVGSDAVKQPEPGQLPTSDATRQEVTDKKNASIHCAPPDNAKRKVQMGRDKVTPIDDQFNLLISGIQSDNKEEELRQTVLPQLVLPHCPLTAAVWMLYQSRVITVGNENIVEGNQEVELRQNGYDAGTVEIVPADDISPAVWTIKVTAGTKPPDDDSDDLTGKVLNGSERRLVFTDYVTASQLAHWLKVQLAKPGKSNPDGSKVENSDPVSSDNFTFLVTAGKTLTPFKHTKNDCPDPEQLSRTTSPSISPLKEKKATNPTSG